MSSVYLFYSCLVFLPFSFANKCWELNAICHYVSYTRLLGAEKIDKMSAISIIDKMSAISIIVRRLHCQRNTIHINLFVSFILRSIICLVKDVFHTPEGRPAVINNTATLTTEGSVISGIINYHSLYHFNISKSNNKLKFIFLAAYQFFKSALIVT